MSSKPLTTSRTTLVAEVQALENGQSLSRALAQTAEGERLNAQGNGLFVSLAR